MKMQDGSLVLEKLGEIYKEIEILKKQVSLAECKEQIIAFRGEPEYYDKTKLKPSWFRMENQDHEKRYIEL